MNVNDKTAPRCTCGLADSMPNSPASDVASMHDLIAKLEDENGYSIHAGVARSCPAAALPAPEADAGEWPPAGWLADLVIAMAENRTQTVQILRDFCAKLPPRPVKPPSDT